MGNRLLFARSPEWASAIGRAATLTAQPDFRLLKATARTRAGFLVCGGVEVFVKRVDTGSLLQGLVDCLRGSRARRTLRGAAILEAAGFAHPKPFAAHDGHLTHARVAVADRKSPSGNIGPLPQAQPGTD